MSNFINHIDQKLRYGDDKLLKAKIPELSASLREDSGIAAVSAAYLRGYVAKVEYSVAFHCFPGELDQQLKLFKRQLQDEIYGDFRRKLIELNRAIYSDEREQALQICNELFKEIEE